MENFKLKTLSQIPTKNAGLHIIAATIGGDNRATVLAVKNHAHSHEYVVWSYHLDMGFYNGSYRDHYEDALTRYFERVKDNSGQDIFEDPNGNFSA